MALSLFVFCPDYVYSGARKTGLFFLLFIIFSFSSSVEVRYSPGQGRFCVAARDVAAGELIALDSAYASMLDREEARALCWNCFQALLAPVPCQGCSGVLFCSFECEKKGREREGGNNVTTDQPRSRPR